jgi:hypothetical protein
MIRDNRYLMTHDQWSKLGEINLGGMDSPNIQFMILGHRGPSSGAFTLLKCILNDYWADAPPQKEGWSKEKIDMVMSKLYYCWCVMLNELEQGNMSFNDVDGFEFPVQLGEEE